MKLENINLRNYFATHADIPWNAVMETLKLLGNATPTVAELVAYRAKLAYCEADAMLEYMGLPHGSAPPPLKFLRVHPDAVVPKYASMGAACFDLSAVDTANAKNHPADRHHAGIFRTGLKVEVPPGWVLKIYSRSGHGFKDAMRLSNCVGVIDSDYRGEIMVALRVDGENSKIKIGDGDRIAQAMLEPAPQCELIEVEELSETARGEGGFGSTGTGAL
jgi:dUTP pyrophosphatase